MEELNVKILKNVNGITQYVISFIYAPTKTRETFLVTRNEKEEKWFILRNNNKTFMNIPIEHTLNYTINFCLYLCGK